MGKITLKHVNKSFGEVAVIPDINLTIEDGEFVVFVGPSGCGKSTLLRLIAGLEDVTAGQIDIDGTDATYLPPAKRGLSMVFQSYALYPHMTVRKNIAFPLKMAGLSEAEQDKKVQNAARILNLTSYLDRRPGQLSGGQRQRVAIGRAIVREPSAFLFDEPLSNLDAALRVTMRQEITELHQTLKTTMIYVTHDQVEAMTMADKIVVMRDGIVEQTGSPLQLYDNPVNTFVAGFIGSPAMNLVAGTWEQGGVRIGDVHIAVARPMRADNGQKVLLGSRPEHLAPTAGGALGARVEVIEPTGADTLLMCTLGGQELTVVVRDRVTLRPGDPVQLAPELDKLHVFDAASGRSLAA